MLRTNTKQFKDNLKNYIFSYFNEYIAENEKFFTSDFLKLAKGNEQEKKQAIIMIFICEILGFNTSKQDILKYYYNDNLYKAFCHWLQGLTNVINTDFYYNESAINIIETLKESTEQEKQKNSIKYNEEKATEFLSKLYYNFLFKEINIFNIRDYYKISNFNNIYKA